MNYHGNSELQRKGRMTIALAGLQRRLSQLIKDLRHSCLNILAEVEARIDKIISKYES
ncbi:MULTISPECIES: hypothetical protein [unclassified Synechocystis]|uniref:hypothetical protein n=1 Tax=unclassified Synechocystis TaxID=2640012 RepID=UPI0003F576D9|nr:MULTISPECIES: hypothetical protein [unclassified Synechocystis]AIE73342.1 hypothetical protein D082_08130 [Synechocystis sp. PCC 6714]MCT0253158.1 hypothetical protein [Synechocystis sp. CS-94]